MIDKIIGRKPKIRKHQNPTKIDVNFGAPEVDSFCSISGTLVLQTRSWMKRGPDCEYDKRTNS